MKLLKNISMLLILVMYVNKVAISKEDKKGHKGHDHSKNEKGHDDHKGHDHSKEEKSHDDHDDHGDEKGHDDHKGHDHGGSKAIGKGKAIVDVDPKKGFKLNKKAIKKLRLKLQTVDGSEFTVKKNTLVTSKNIKGVYRYRSGYFKLLPAKILKQVKGGYRVSAKGVDFGDQIVIDGVGLLRVSDVYSTDKSEYGHSH